MKRLSLVTVTFLAVWTLSPQMFAAKPTTYPPMALTVAVDAQNCGICPDDGGDYIDGVDGVSAIFDQYGNFIFSTQTTRTKIRSLIYEYSAFNPAAPPMPESGSNHYMATLRVEPGVGLQVLPQGESQRLASCPIYDDDSSAFQYPTRFLQRLPEGLGTPRICSDRHADANDLGDRPGGSGLSAGVPSSNKGPDCSPRRWDAVATIQNGLDSKVVTDARHSFKLAVQFSTTVKGTDALGPAGVTSRNRLPSAATSTASVPRGV